MKNKNHHRKKSTKNHTDDVLTNLSSGNKVKIELASFNGLNSQLPNLMNSFNQIANENLLRAINASLKGPAIVNINSLIDLRPRFIGMPMIGSTINNLNEQTIKSINTINSIGGVMTELGKNARNFMSNFNTVNSINTGIAKSINLIAAKDLHQRISYYRPEIHGINDKQSVLDNILFSGLNIGRSSSELLSLKGVKFIGSPNVLSSIAFTAAHAYSVEKALSSFAWKDLGNQIGMDSVTKIKVRNSFLDLSRNYSTLLNSFQEKPSSFLNFSPNVNKVASLEYYSSANVLEVISNENSTTVENEIQYENEYSLNSYLPQIHPGLLDMWKGAIQTYNSSNSDRVRHFAVSLRELLGHLMHRLAPDEAIKVWTTDSTLFTMANLQEKRG